MLKDEDGWVFNKIEGGGYKPEENFSLGDLTGENLKLMYSERPELFTLSAIMKMKPFKSPEVEEKVNDLKNIIINKTSDIKEVTHNYTQDKILLNMYLKTDDAVDYILNNMTLGDDVDLSSFTTDKFFNYNENHVDYEVRYVIKLLPEDKIFKYIQEIYQEELDDIDEAIDFLLQESDSLYFYIEGWIQNKAIIQYEKEVKSKLEDTYYFLPDQDSDEIPVGLVITDNKEAYLQVGLDKKNCASFERIFNTTYPTELLSELRKDYVRLENDIANITAIGNFRDSDAISDIKEEFPMLF